MAKKEPNKQQALYNYAKEGLIRRLFGYLNQERFEDLLNWVFGNYYFIMNYKPDHELSEPEYFNVLNIALFDIRHNAKEQVIQTFYREHEDELSDLEQEIIKGWFNLYVSIYQLEEADDERGYLYRDLLTDDIFRVQSDSLLTEDVRENELIIARVSKIGQEYQVLGSLYSLPSVYKGAVISAINEIIADYREQIYEEEGRQPSIREFLNRAVFQIIALPGYINQALQDPELSLVNTFGDLSYTAVYRIKNRNFIYNKLLTSPQIALDENEDYLVWVDNEDEGLVNGVIKVTEDELILEAENERQLSRGKNYIKNLLGIAALHREDRVRDIEDFYEDVLENNQEGYPGVSRGKLKPRDEVEKLLWEKMKDFYTPWERENALLLWRDFLKEEEDFSGRPTSWASGVEYIINRLDFVNFTQEDIGDKYGVSATTVSKKYRYIYDYLDIVPFDTRYGTVNIY